jgi:hypothetical protein
VEVHAQENERPEDDRKDGGNDLADILKVPKIVVVRGHDQPDDQIGDRDETPEP